MMTPQPTPYYTPTPPRRKPQRTPWIVLAVAVVAAATAITLAAAGVFSSNNPTDPQPVVAATFVIHGTVSVSCGTCTGYGDIRDGAQVEIVDNAHNVLAAGALDVNTDVFSNTHTFTVPGVPAGRGMYGVHVGNVNRGVVWESEDQVVSSGFALSIGS